MLKNSGCRTFVVAAMPAIAISFIVLAAVPHAHAMMMLLPPSDARLGVIAVLILSPLRCPEGGVRHP
jgi:hypothetical protein